jgi:hypothetical protein
MKTLSIDNLLYEEMVLLQSILIQVSDHQDFIQEDQAIFDSLFEKVMSS